jgi:hypothetical protein
VRDDTHEVLIVCEALHASARDDMPRLVTDLAGALNEVWGLAAETRLLSSTDLLFGFS